MRAGGKETVIIVHGTWAGPEASVRRWYEPSNDGYVEGFPSKLDRALQRRGSLARCWAHCESRSGIFTWSGHNNWIGRARASAELADYVNRLQNEGWRCHLVAHSHGGNVVRDALPRILTPATAQGGTVTSLGTPFIDAMVPIEARRKRGRLVRAVADGIFVVLLLMAALIGFFGLWAEGDRHGWALFSAGAGGLALFIAGVPILGLGAKAVASFRRYRQRRRAAPMRPRWLAIGSAVDEAWQILHHLRRFDNPFVRQRSVLSFLVANWREQAARSVEIARIHGARSWGDLTVAGRIGYVVVLLLGGFCALMIIAIQPHQLRGSYVEFATGISLFWLAIVFWSILVFGWTFYSALWAPLRWIARQAGALFGLPSAVGTYFVRKKAWTLVQAAAMGLDGYGYALPEVTNAPTSPQVETVVYDDMPTHVEQRALRRRDAWLTAHFGAVSDTFSQISVTAADIAALLQKIESDMSLVHAAYYMEDDCIEQIASWIAQPRES